MIQFQSQDTDKFISRAKAGYERLLKSAKDGAPFTGWVNLPQEQKWASEAILWSTEKRKWSGLIVLGIGGSSLGARAVIEALSPFAPVKFLENVDGLAFYQELEHCDLNHVQFLAISKSGSTLETLFQLGAVIDLLNERDLTISNHMTVISERKKSPLTDLAAEQDIPVYDVPLDVGGRFSVLSNVGLFPIAWAGVDVAALLEGAQWARSQKDLIAQITNSSLLSFERGEWISVFWLYAERLRTWGLWLEQLWAESLAKRATRSGKEAPRVSTPLTAIGATDQHSLLQQFMEGAPDKYFTFVRCHQSETSRPLSKGISPSLALLEGKSLGELLSVEAQSIQEALRRNKRSSSTLLIDKMDAKNLGALLYLYEAVVGTLGECLDVDAFNQPGVELGKQIMLGKLGDPRYRKYI